MTTVLFDYMAAAEPRLLPLRGRTGEDVAAEVRSLVGARRTWADWRAVVAQHPCPPDRDAGLWAVEVFGRAHPAGDLTLRLYSDFHDEPSRGQCRCKLCSLIDEMGLRADLNALEDREQKARQRV